MFAILILGQCVGCIDKSSSSELQEAINSMFRWYAEANVCYLYLQDLNCPAVSDLWRENFRASTWFTRGWTLQELLAPPELLFHDTDWKRRGSLRDLVEDVSIVTTIGTDVLLHKRPLETVSVATRMSWAADRQTTRIEDKAYSLLGIFDVNMPVLVSIWFLYVGVLFMAPHIE